MSVSRIVALFAPLLAVGAGWTSATIAKHTGVVVDPAGLTALYVTGAGTVLGLAWKWLDGRSKWERQKEQEAAELEHARAFAEDRAVEAPAPVSDIETVRAVLGLGGIEKDVSHALAAMHALGARIDILDRKTSARAGTDESGWAEARPSE
jgi:hypothetical protein